MHSYGYYYEGMKPPTEQREWKLGREYLRVSFDRLGRERSVTEQHGDNERYCESRGIRLGMPYQDNDRSASKYAKKRREDFDRLISDLENDRFGAENLVLWEFSRGSRKVSEWVQLIELLELRRVRVIVTSDGAMYDPSNPRDYRAMIDDANDAQYESSKTSKRIKRAVAASAVAGRPHGKVPFGFLRRYDERTGELVAQELDPDEAPVVKELFERMVKGHTLNAIARDFEARGITTRSGKPLARTYLRQLVVSDAYMGVRIHDPGRDAGNPWAKTAEVQFVEAQWPAIVDKATFLAVKRIVSDPSRQKSRSGRAQHVFTSAIKCGVCKGRLAVKNRRASQFYCCRDHGCCTVIKDELDLILESAILDYLASDKVYQNLGGLVGHSDELEKVQAELIEARAALDALYDDVAARKVSSKALQRIEPQMEADITRLEERETELSTPSALQGLIQPGKDVRKRWKAAALTTKREIARLLFSPNIMGDVNIMPSKVRGKRQIVHERIEWRRATQE